MHLPTYEMPVKEIILVEPGAHLQNGHYREKLSLWVKGFRFAGWNKALIEKKGIRLGPQNHVGEELESVGHEQVRLVRRSLRLYAATVADC
jgi:hypothetical protein